MMRIRMAAVISIDGKIKQAGNVHKRDWISDEDKAYFNQLMDAYDVIVMGRKTYSSMALKPQENTHYVVVTNSPAFYASSNRKESIDFCSSTPQQIVKKYGELGFSRLLLIGGSSLYAGFLEAGLVDELDLTLEPIIIGSGKSLVDSLNKNIRLQVIQQVQLNSRGTLLLQMELIRNK